MNFLKGKKKANNNNKGTTKSDSDNNDISGGGGRRLGTRAATNDDSLYDETDIEELDALILSTINIQTRKLLLSYHKNIKDHLPFQKAQLSQNGNNNRNSNNNVRNAAINRFEKNNSNTTTKEYDIMDKKVLRIHEIVPDINLGDIALLLTHCNGNEETALDLLLSQSVNITELRENKGNSGTDSQDGNKLNESNYSDRDLIISLGLLLAQKEEEKQNGALSQLVQSNLNIEEQYLKQIELKNMLQEQRRLLGIATGTPSPQSSNSTPDMEKKLAFEKKMIEKRMREEKLQRNTQFYCKGETKAMLNNRLERFVLGRTNIFDCDAEQIHFRIAESQFQRQGSSTTYSIGSSYKVTSVEYIVNPKLVQKFNQCKINLAQKHGFMVESMKPLLLFHGTSNDNMENIIKTNFLLEKVGSATDMGWYGKGFYFSEYPSMSISYSRGNPYLLICLVLVGKAHRMAQVNTGCPKVDGYDSHVSPDGSSEVIIFDPDQVLPCYKVKYEASSLGMY